MCAAKAQRLGMPPDSPGQQSRQGLGPTVVQTFILRIASGFSTDRWVPKTPDSVRVLSRRIMLNTGNPSIANAARTCVTTMSPLLSSWIGSLVTGANVNSDSSKPQVSQSVRMGTA